MAPVGISLVRRMHFHGIGKARAVSVRSVEVLQPVQRPFGHVAGDAGKTSIELVADENAAAGARMRCPPANAIGRLLREVGKYVGLQRRPAGQLQAKRCPRVLVGRLDMFGIGFAQAGNVGGSHSNSLSRLLTLQRPKFIRWHAFLPSIRTVSPIASLATVRGCAGSFGRQFTSLRNERSTSPEF